MSEAPRPTKPKIDWRRMDKVWWIDAVLRVAFLGTTLAFVINVAPTEPRWLAKAVVGAFFFLGILFWPFPPRIGEEGPVIRFHHSLMAFGILIAVVAIVALVAALFAGSVVLGSVIMGAITDRVTLTSFLLMCVVALLWGIFVRLGVRR